MVYVGIDHSTTAIRMALLEEGRPAKAETYEIPKVRPPESFVEFIGDKVDLSEIRMVAVAYSMGDAITSIVPLSKVKDRGMRSLEGIGPHTGVGTKMFDEVRDSGLPAVAIPGLHDQCPWLDPRFMVLQSHLAAPKKVAASFYCYSELSKKSKKIHDVIVAHVSSNTVTVLIKDGQLVGAVDATVGAPGLRHGPLDVEAIRKVDRKELTANEAFASGGILRPPFETSEKLFQGLKRKDTKAQLLMESLVMAVAMEVGGLVTVAGGVDAVALTGALGEMKGPVDVGTKLGKILRMNVQVFSRFSAALGAAEIAKLVAEGADDIIGIPVETER